MSVEYGRHKGMDAAWCELAFRELLQSVADGVVLTDLCGRILAFNNELLNTWGPGTNLQERIAEGANWIELCTASGAPSRHSDEMKATLEHAQESTTYVELKSGVSLLELSRPMKINDLCIGRLWTYRRLAESDEALLTELSLREITDLMPQLVFICGRSGMNVYFNQSWVDYTGLSQEESRGHGWTQVFAPDNQTAGSHALDTGTGYEIEAQLRRYDGVYRWFLIRALPLRTYGDEVELWLGTCTDIHEMKVAQQRLKAIQDELEDRVQERTRALQLAMEQAEAASRAKDDFLSRMSHELRTPLNAILGFGQLLEMEDLEAECAENVQLIVRSGRYLLDLINEVLDIAKIEAGGGFSAVPTPLASVMRESIDLVRPLAESRGITLALDCSLREGTCVLADRRRLQQVFVNLLSNGVKYNYESGQLTVRTKSDGTGQIQVAITDTGPGLTPDQMTRLFSPFERLDAANTSIEGTGLGLAFAKQLTTAMGGTIGVRSTVGEGSTFTVELPEAVTTAAEASELLLVDEDVITGQDHRKVSLLVVSDSEPMFELFRAVLAGRHELEAQRVDSCEEALEQASNWGPVVLIIDLDNEHQTEAEVQEVLAAYAETPAIAVSSQRPSGASASRFVAWSDRILDGQELNSAIDQAMLAKFHAA